MRIAFCITGQLRNEELSFPLTAQLASSLNAKVFLSTWRDRGSKTSGVILQSQFNRMFGDNFSGVVPYRILEYGFSKAFPNFESLIISPGDTVENADITKYFPESIVDIEEDTLSLEFGHDVKDTNSMRMLYKIWRCNEMKRAYEKSSGSKFDIVVRFRPDIVPSLNSEILEGMLSNNFSTSLWTHHAGQPNFVSDVLSISDSIISNYYASLFGKSIQAPRRPWRLIHHELYDHLAEAGITVKNITTRQWITEDFCSRQYRNRLALLKTLRAGQVDPFVFETAESWTRLLDVFDLLIRVEDGSVTAIEFLEFLDHCPLTVAEFPGQLCFIYSKLWNVEHDPDISYASMLMHTVASLCARDMPKNDLAEVRNATLIIHEIGLGLNYKLPLSIESLELALDSAKNKSLSTLSLALNTKFSRERICHTLSILREYFNLQ